MGALGWGLGHRPIRPRCQLNNAPRPKLNQSSQYVTLFVTISYLPTDSHWVFTIRSPPGIPTTPVLTWMWVIRMVILPDTLSSNELLQY